MPNNEHSEPRLVVHHVDGAYVLGTFGNCLLSVWRTEFALPAAMHWAHTLNDLRASLPGTPLGGLSYMETTCRLPAEAAAADTFAEALRRHSPVLKGIAVVYERDGFWGAGARSQLTAVFNESKAVIPYLMFVALEPAAAWLLEALNQPAQDRIQLMQCIEQLRGAQDIRR
jgi:hypothetical protein